MVKDLTKEKRPRGEKTPGYVFSEANYLVTTWIGADFVTRPAPVDFFLEREMLTRLKLSQPEVSRLGLPPVS